MTGDIFALLIAVCAFIGVLYMLIQTEIYYRKHPDERRHY